MIARSRFLARLPRDLALACGAGIAVGALAAVIAYVSYVRAGGPTWTGVVVIPGSLALVGATYATLARRRKLRASDWLALGYTAAIVAATGLLAAHEFVREVYAELNVVVW